MFNKARFFAIAVSFLFLLLFSSANNIKAQTSLVAGDIAFSGYSSDDPDEFSFVLLKNITATTVINFTDNGWLSTNVFRTGETTVTWTATTALSAGQEIKIAGLVATLASGPGSAGTVTGGALSLSTVGDSVTAYQGTAASPTIISAIHMNVNLNSIDPLVPDTTTAAWDGTANGSNYNALPPTLTTGTNAIWIGTFQTATSEFDNARFTCGSADISTVALARASLNNQANWLKVDTPGGFTLPTGCAYLVVTAASVSLGGRVVTADGRGIPNARISITNGDTRSLQTNPFGYYQFEGFEAGATYVVTISSKQYQFGTPTRVITIFDNLSDIDFQALP